MKKKDLVAASPPAEPLAPLTEGAALEFIRTETVLSKFPLHNLSKGRIDIQILKTASDNGQVELKWEVSYNERYGQARQLAYKLDTIVIDPKLDQLGRPLPETVRLGSLHDICQQLGLTGGKNKSAIKKALLQNAGAFINAKLKYRANDGSERPLHAGFARYSVIFTGEKFPDGRKTDAVYIVLNQIYREILNYAPTRPLDLAYKKVLAPAAQRLYEIVSYKIFSALKNKHPYAKLLYSEYCTFSTQQRYFDYDHFKKQMYKVHLPHLKSGYLEKVHYESAPDDPGGKTDWFMCYIPGPKARAEFSAAQRGTRARPPVDVQVQVETPGDAKHAPRQRALPLPMAEPPKPVNPQLFAELIRRGISPARAASLLSSLPEDQPFTDQLEWGDYLITRQPEAFRNPPGFYISLLRDNITPPENFETSRARKLREEARQAHTLQEQRRAQLEIDYREYRARLVEDYITAHMSPADLQALVSAKAAERRREYRTLPPSTILEIAQRDARIEVAKMIALPSFESFCAEHEPRVSE